MLENRLASNFKRIHQGFFDDFVVAIVDYETIAAHDHHDHIKAVSNVIWFPKNICIQARVRNFFVILFLT